VPPLLYFLANLELLKFITCNNNNLIDKFQGSWSGEMSHKIPPRDVSAEEGLLSHIDDDDDNESQSHELDDITRDVSRNVQTEGYASEEETSRSSGEQRAIFKELWVRNKGVVLVLLSMFFAASMDMAVKILEIPSQHGGTAMNTFQILFIRHVLTSAGILTYGFVSKGGVPGFPLGDPKVRGLLIARGVAGFVAVFGIYFSLPYLPLTEATVLTFMAPIITCYANTLLLEGEAFTRMQQLASGVSVLGVLLIAFTATVDEQEVALSAHSTISSEHRKTAQGLKAPNVIPKNLSSPSGLRLLAIFVALLGVFGQAGGMVTTRLIGPRAHPLVIMNYSSIASIIFCGLALLTMHGVSLPTSMSVVQWLLLLVVTFCGFMFQLLLTQGLQYGAATKGVQKFDHEPGDPSSGQEPGCQRLSRLTYEDCDGEEETGAEEKAPKQHVGVNRAVGMMYMQALFALMYDWTIWRSLPSLSSWAGIVLIATGAIWVAVTK